jgi:two-component sensor histidine kinase
MSRFEPLFIPEEKFEDSAGSNSKWMQIIKVPLNYKDNEKQVLCILTDITSRKIAEENIKTSLRQKELLLQEIHHRVKNNLQIVVSLLKLQSRYVYDKRDLEIFNKSRARVETMSLIHEKLYKSADLANISMRDYLRDLTAQLLKAYEVDSSHVILTVDSEDVNAGIDTAIPCGLIVNELVSNSLKHAFRINQVGRIEINVKKENSSIILCFNDNGVGLPAGFDLETSESLGLQLVTTLVKQLDGTINIDSSRKGTSIVVMFPEMNYKDKV